MTVRKQLALIAAFQTNVAAYNLVFAFHFHHEGRPHFSFIAGAFAFCAFLQTLTAMLYIHKKNLNDTTRRLLGVDPRTSICDKCAMPHADENTKEH